MSVLICMVMQQVHKAVRLHTALQDSIKGAISTDNIKKQTNPSGDDKASAVRDRALVTLLVSYTFCSDVLDGTVNMNLRHLATPKEGSL